MTSHSIRPRNLREGLLRQRRELSSLGRVERDAVRAEAEASHSVALDVADASALDLQTDIELALLEMQSDAITHIDHALDRLDAGTYEACDECGMEISAARLRAQPSAERCLQCEEAHESSRERWQPFGVNRPPDMPFAGRENESR